MNNNELYSKIAVLESKIDQLESELSYLDDVLIRCGFSDGIATLKETVHELLSEEAEVKLGKNSEL